MSRVGLLLSFGGGEGVVVENTSSVQSIREHRVVEVVVSIQLSRRVQVLE